MFFINSLTGGERDMIRFSDRFSKSKLWKLFTSYVKKNNHEVTGKHLFNIFPSQGFPQHHPSAPNTDFFIREKENKPDFIFRKLSSTASDKTVQSEEKNQIKYNSISHIKKPILIIGGGQAGLAVAYFLNKHNVEYIVLDSEKGPGGAWQHGWDSLRLFSPAEWSSLHGWPMPATERGYPSKDHVIHYLAQYEKRYQIPIERPVEVKTIRKARGSFLAYTDKGVWESKLIISATGKWSHPFIPEYPGRESYKGRQIHSAHYQNPEPFKDQQVLIVGGGNSAAQILAEVSKVAQTIWVTLEPPFFLPDEIDGRVLFERATERWKASQEGRTVEIPKGGFGDIVMVPSVKEARARNVLNAVRPFKQFTEQGVIWQDGTHSEINSVIWCTGFKPALEHLQELNVIEPDDQVSVVGTQSVKEPGLWLVGYGDWVGYASATLIGVARTARRTATEVAETLRTLSDSNAESPAFKKQ